jgi:hypothetical protein
LKGAFAPHIRSAYLIVDGSWHATRVALGTSLFGVPFDGALALIAEKICATEKTRS